MPVPCNLSPDDSLEGELPGAVSVAELSEVPAAGVSWGIRPIPESVEAVDEAAVMRVVVDVPVVVDDDDVALELSLLVGEAEAALAANPVSIISFCVTRHNV